MNRRNLWVMTTAGAAMTMAAMASAQQSAQDQSQSQYQGVSHPSDDPIVASPDTPPAAPKIAKPSAAVLAAPAEPQQQMVQPSSAGPVDPDAGYVGQNGVQAQQAMNRQSSDPDGDIVQVRTARPGELTAGTSMRVKLMDRISSRESEKGEPFRGTVASDVLQDGKVMIPAGATIEGRVNAVTSGHFGGHGSFRLQPDAVVLPDGSKFQIRAEVTGTPGSKTRVGGEGTVNPGSRAKKNGIEYGAVVGAGAVTGAVVGGPVGALTGGLIGAGVVTTHLMVDHPQATLEPGAILLFTLTEPMNLMPASN